VLKLYLMVFGFAFLPAYFFGLALPGKRSRGIFGTLAGIGVILTIIGTAFLFSIGNSPSAAHGGAGLAFLLILLPFIGSLSFGLLGGIVSRLANDWYGKTRNGLWENFVVFGPFFIPLGLTFVLCLMDILETTKTKREQEKELLGYWQQDVSVQFGDHRFDLPLSPRLKVNYRGFGSARNARQPFADLENKGGLRSLFVYGLKDNCRPYDKNCAFVKKQNSKWCKLRPEYRQSVWCLDYLNGDDIKFETDAVVHFEERKKWFGNSSSDSIVHQRYSRGNRKIITHTNLGQDKRGEDIISACSDFLNKKFPYCVLEHAVEDDVLASLGYRMPRNSITEQELKEKVLASKRLWKSLKSNQSAELNQE